MTKRKAEWQNNYIARTYDRINLTVSKGKKDALQEHAQKHGKSLNSFINEAIDNQIERDNNANQPIEEQHENS